MQPRRSTQRQVAIMATPWVILTTRYGSDIRTPSVGQLHAALDELRAQKDDTEHPDAWLRYGDDDGPMYVVTVNTSGRVCFSQWADCDYENELTPEGYLESVSPEKQLELWQMLLRADVQGLQREPWIAR
jgi:hypothetical protein